MLPTPWKAFPFGICVTIDLYSFEGIRVFESLANTDLAVMLRKIVCGNRTVLSHFLDETGNNIKEFTYETR